MLGKFIEQVQINAAASEVWNLYGTNEFPKFVVEKLPHIVEKVELIEGNGGAGTLVQVSKLLIYYFKPRRIYLRYLYQINKYKLCVVHEHN